MESYNLKGPVTKCPKCTLNKGLDSTTYLAWVLQTNVLKYMISLIKTTVSACEQCVAHLYVFVWLKPCIQAFLQLIVF